MEWKFGLAVVEEQYARRHAIVIPYNLLTYLIARCYFAAKRDTREQVWVKNSPIFETFMLIVGSMPGLICRKVSQMDIGKYCANQKTVNTVI